jgi:LysR family hydrogen peroxide-inducible transcriptional activator
MDPMELHQLRYFCAAARTRSFTKAAEEEGISQPALSEAIHKLEAELKVPLFARLGRSTRLTPEGERFLPSAQQALRLLAEARAAAQPSSAERPLGRLRVGAIPTILPYFLAPMLPRFQRKFPGVELSVVEGQTARLVEKLQAGDVDIAVLGLPVRSPELVCSELFREPLSLTVARNSRLAERASIAVSELRNEKVLLLREGHCFRDDVLSTCRRARVVLNSWFETDHLASVFAMSAAGMGVGIVPAMAAPHALDCVVLPLAPAGERRVGYARLRKPYVSPAERAFAVWLREVSAGSARDRRPRAAYCQI